MAEQKEKSGSSPRGPKQNNPMRVVALGVLGILLVLIIANLQAILSPFRALGAILAPITIGFVLAYLLNPFLRFFEKKVFYRIKRRTANRALSLLCSYLLLFAFIAGMLLLVIPQLVDSINDLRTNGLTYINRLIDSINAFVAKLPITLPENSENLINLEKLLTYVVNLLSEYGASIVGSVGTIAGSVVTVLKNIIIGVFVSVYVLLAKDRLYAFFTRMLRAFFGKKQENTLLHYCKTANTKFGGFVVGKMFDSLVVGVTCAILFTIFKIPYPIMIAVVIGVTDFIPFFGPFLGAIPSGLIIMITSPSKLLLFVILILVVQQLDGNILAPMILGDHTGLSSLGVLVSVTVMGGLLGFAGMLIGVPLAALILAILDDVTKARLKRKGAPTDLYEYYAANAFIRPKDEEGSESTLTQKFVRWVCSVEQEEPAKSSKRRFISYYFRLGCFKFGRFVHHIFAVKQLPEDREGSLFADIAKKGIPTNRTLGRTVLFSVITLGIYPLYLTEVIAETTNITCHKDKKRTWGVIPVCLLAILTLGIYPLIWHCRLIRRFSAYCKRNKRVCPVTQKEFLLWALPGLLILAGPFIAYHKFLKAFNLTAEIFNETHTFPLAEASIKETLSDGATVPAESESAVKESNSDQA